MSILSVNFAQTSDKLDSILEVGGGVHVLLQ